MGRSVRWVDSGSYTFLTVKREQKVRVEVPEPSDAVEFARAKLGFEPDLLQAEVLASTANRGILNCSRQWGKSTVAAAKAVHRAYTRPGSLVQVACVCLRQSGE